MMPTTTRLTCNVVWRLRGSTVRPSSSFASRHFSSKRHGLPPPNIIYTDNHILVVDKPPGWHSVPNQDDPNSKKCLLTYLQSKKWGGGSKKDFLKPIHRIDQPCSGILLLAKTSKAASRIAQVWKQKQVEKTYLCMIQALNVGPLQDRSTAVLDNEEEGWNRLEGYLHKRKRKPKSDENNPLAGWSVIVTAKEPPHEEARHVSLEWKPLLDNLLLVQTKDGARHVIRALLGQVGQCPLLGDVRYNSEVELPDRSVALHARSLQLPDALKLGTTTERYFEAPTPKSWKRFAKLEEEERME